MLDVRKSDKGYCHRKLTVHIYFKDVSESWSRGSDDPVHEIAVRRTNSWPW